MRVLAALVAVVGCVLAYQSTRAAIALSQAAAEAQTIADQARDGDVSKARRTAADLRRHAAVGRASTDGVLWAATTLVPVVGEHTLAVRQTAVAVDELAGGALAPGLDVAEQLGDGALRGDGGAFDVEAIAALERPVREAGPSVGRADAALADIETGWLLPPLRGRVAELRSQVAGIDAGLRSASYAVRLLPGMLGGEGERRYLLVVQNNAEVRATGGLPGSVSMMRVRGGAMTLEPLGPAVAFKTSAPDVVKLTSDERRLLGSSLATDLRDSNATPDFPRAAMIMSRLVERKLSRQVDGVIAIDPVTLAAVLEATGPLKVAGQRLDADNAVGKLLFEPYQELPTDAQQNAYFASVSDGILDALLGGGGADQGRLLGQLAGGVSQRRLLVWSRDGDEQALLARAGVAGALPSGAGDQPQVGLYLNDAVAYKIDFFLSHHSRLVALDCTPDGRQVVQTRMRLSSRVPTPVSQLTDFVVGDGRYAPRGVIALNLAMYAPAGGELRALQVDGKATRVAQGEIGGRQVSVLGVFLDPGQNAEVVAEFVTRPGQEGDPRLEWTPGIEWGPTEQTVRSACR